MNPDDRIDRSLEQEFLQRRLARIKSIMGDPGLTFCEKVAKVVGSSVRSAQRGVQIHRHFNSAVLRDHKFKFPDGQCLTLKEYFEPKILAARKPMGSGAVLARIRRFLGPDGKPLEHPPPSAFQ